MPLTLLCVDEKFDTISGGEILRSCSKKPVFFFKEKKIKDDILYKISLSTLGIARITSQCAEE